MAIEYVSAYKGVRFYCTTSERAFGPILPDADTGARFIAFLGADPRRFGDVELARQWHLFQMHFVGHCPQVTPAHLVPYDPRRGQLLRAVLAILILVVIFGACGVLAALEL